MVAVDLQQDFLRQVLYAAEQNGLSHLIETQCGDMTVLHDQPGTINLIWAEGAIYCAGFDRALSVWRPLLAEGGIVACSELSWLTENPSTEPTAFWQLNYPGMRSVVHNVTAAEGLGYKCITHFTQPLASWWDEFYNPWLCHIDTLKLEAEQDQDLRKLMDDALMEINLFRKYSHEYGYEFYLLQKSN